MGGVTIQYQLELLGRVHCNGQRLLSSEPGLIERNSMVFNGKVGAGRGEVKSCFLLTLLQETVQACSLVGKES